MLSCEPVAFATVGVASFERGATEASASEESIKNLLLHIYNNIYVQYSQYHLTITNN